MLDKYQNKYRISSARLQSYDYGSAGMYFITICTKNRLHYFGEIDNGIMQFSKLGNIATEEWIKTPNIRPDMNLELGAFVVMPNHFHAILIIGNNQYNRQRDTQRIVDRIVDRRRRDAMHCVSTRRLRGIWVA